MAWDWDKLQQQKKSRPGGGSGEPPGMDEVIDRIRNAKGNLPGKAWLIIVVIALIYFGFSCVYSVPLGEVGIIQRFGDFNRIEQPGLNFKLPNGIEKLTKVNIKQTFTEEFGAVQASTRRRSRDYEYPQSESLMLTGDLNVAVVPWTVQYKVKDPVKYLFKVNNVLSTLRDLSESSMRLVVGDRSVDEVISERVQIADQAHKLLQKELDEAETGIRVDRILMEKTNVPEPVQPSFNQVNQAIQEKKTIVLRANEAYFKVIPTAKGTAEKTIREAEGYALDRKNRAEGDANRFLALYEEYKKAKVVTRKRLYLEAMLEIYPKIGKKYIVDSDQKNLLPLLNLTNPEGGKK